MSSSALLCRSYGGQRTVFGVHARFPGIGHVALVSHVFEVSSSLRQSAIAAAGSIGSNASNAALSARTSGAAGAGPIFGISSDKSEPTRTTAQVKNSAGRG